MVGGSGGEEAEGPHKAWAGSAAEEDISGVPRGCSAAGTRASGAQRARLPAHSTTVSPWRAETQPGRRPSTCLVRNMSCGACQRAPGSELVPGAPSLEPSQDLGSCVYRRSRRVVRKRRPAGTGSWHSSARPSRPPDPASSARSRPHPPDPSHSAGTRDPPPHGARPGARWACIRAAGLGLSSRVGPSPTRKSQRAKGTVRIHGRTSIVQGAAVKRRECLFRRYLF